jgi:hypothetical protein
MEFALSDFMTSNRPHDWSMETGNMAWTGTEAGGHRFIESGKALTIRKQNTNSMSELQDEMLIPFAINIFVSRLALNLGHSEKLGPSHT